MKALKKEESPPIEARVVYTHAPVQLAVLLGGDGTRWRVRMGSTERELEAAPDVDPALLLEVAAREGRVLVDAGPPALIAGVLQTSRSLSIDRDGHVAAEVKSLRIKAIDEVVLRTEAAFVRVRDSDVELVGRKVVMRARTIAKILGRMIALN
jgi:hypothetical protein